MAYPFKDNCVSEYSVNFSDFVLTYQGDISKFSPPMFHQLAACFGHPTVGNFDVSPKG